MRAASYGDAAAGTPLQALGFGSRSGDSFWPQLHDDTVALLPRAECEGLQAAYSISGAASSLSTQACTGGSGRV